MTNSIVGREGFDHYNGTGANTGLASRWTPLAGAAGTALSLISGRFGGQAVRSTPAIGYQVSRDLLPATYTDFTISFAFRIPTLGAATTFVWLLRDGATQICLGSSATGQVIVYRGDTGGVVRAGSVELGRSTLNVIRANTWHYGQWSVKIDDTTGTVALKIDGAVAFTTLTSQDTKAQTTTGINNVDIGAAGLTVTVDHDDIVYQNSTTPLSNETRIEFLRASIDTAQKDWLASTGSNNAAMVDDTTADGDTTYVQSTNVGDLDLYDLADLSTTPTTIYGVAPVIYARKTDAATRQLVISGSSGGTAQDGAAINLAASHNVFGPDVYELDWHDSAAWTKAKVDALKLGPKVAS